MFAGLMCTTGVSVVAIGVAGGGVERKEHVVAPAVLPVEQFVQLETPMTAEYVPAAHGTHAAWPCAEA